MARVAFLYKREPYLWNPPVVRIGDDSEQLFDAATYSGERQVAARRWHLLTQENVFDMIRQSDIYLCPGGKQLRTSGTVHDDKTLLYRASRRDCGICPLKPQCCPKEPSRKIPRDIHERARDVARSFVGSEGFEQSRQERKKIEMRFAHLKRILELDRQDEFVLAAIAQNLRRLAKLVARPPPYALQCIA